MIKKVIGLDAGRYVKLIIETLNSMGGLQILRLVDSKPEIWGQQVIGRYKKIIGKLKKQPA